MPVFSFLIPKMPFELPTQIPLSSPFVKGERGGFSTSFSGNIGYRTIEFKVKTIGQA
jgi:hypothetical protein